MDANEQRNQDDTVMVVADWTLDPHAVVAACVREAERKESSLELVVPAWLHGLDWVGDPAASVPCAHRQLATLSALLASAGLSVAGAHVGDPDPMSAIADALESPSVGRILLITRKRRLARHPLSLARRATRLTSLPVVHVVVPAAAARGRFGRPVGHCQAAQHLATAVGVRNRGSLSQT